jgi:transcriptional regulator with XRE-family HTH domain
MRLRTIFATNLRLLRSTMKCTQEQLAECAGISTNHVGMLEREERGATIEVIEKLAGALGVDPARLLKTPQQRQPQDGADQ